VELIPQWIKQKRNKSGGHCNHQAVKIIAQYANDNQVKLIHVSTIMFLMEHQLLPYKREAITQPINVYGALKVGSWHVLR
jgi:dTDP-4-dehydrorhamnose reductase